MLPIRKYWTTTTVAMLVALLFAAPPEFWLRPACAAQAKPAKIFAADTTLALTLTAPWRDFIRSKTAKKRYLGTLEYVDESGAKRTMPVAFKPRGLNRLKVCQLPPIKLIFDKQAVRGTPFRGNKSLKLVTHCGRGERWEQYAIKEMLAYRIYNVLTERSFKVRPLSVTYVDSAEQSSDGPHFGFLIEDDSDVAKRNRLHKVDVTRIGVDQLAPLDSSRFSLFEYLIGNTDFSVLDNVPGKRCCHNSVLFGAKTQSKVLAVPYDFDSSGLVDAHYAVPNKILHIRSNRERVFRGFCADNAMLDTARRDILGLEPRIMELARTDGRLTDRSRDKVSDYLSKGFEVLRDDAKFARDVTAKCRK